MTLTDIEFPCPVRRILFSWTDGQWSIQRETRIEKMTLPKSSEFPPTGRQRGVSGFWWEATNSEGKVIYRRVAQDPTRHVVEFFEADGSISQKVADQDEGILEVLVPDLPEITEIHFYSSSLGPGKGKMPESEIGLKANAVFKFQHNFKHGGENGSS